MGRENNMIKIYSVKKFKSKIQKNRKVYLTLLGVFGMFKGLALQPWDSSASKQSLGNEKTVKEMICCLLSFVLKRKKNPSLSWLETQQDTLYYLKIL